MSAPKVLLTNERKKKKKRSGLPRREEKGKDEAIEQVVVPLFLYKNIMGIRPDGFVEFTIYKKNLPLLLLLFSFPVPPLQLRRTNERTNQVEAE